MHYRYNICSWHKETARNTLRAPRAARRPPSLKGAHPRYCWLDASPSSFHNPHPTLLSPVSHTQTHAPPIAKTQERAAISSTAKAKPPPWTMLGPCAHRHRSSHGRRRQPRAPTLCTWARLALPRRSRSCTYAGDGASTAPPPIPSPVVNGAMRRRQPTLSSPPPRALAMSADPSSSEAQLPSLCVSVDMRWLVCTPL